MATAEQETAVLTPAALDRAAGVELLGEQHGSGYKQGAALVRRADGQMVQLGPLMYALLECIDGRKSLEELAKAMCERLGRACDVEMVRALAEKLAAHGLLAGSEQNAPPRRNPLLALRFKVLVTNPRATRLVTAPFTFLFHPLVLWPVVAAFVAVLWFVLFHKGIASGTSQAFDQPGLLLLVFALGVASAGFHELGHAAAARYGGATPGGMGMGIYMVWPAFYTDVTDAYRLPRRDRLRVDLGGIYFNALIAVVTVGVWLAWHVDALLLLVALQLLMMVKNLSPMIRSDGYHVLADATGVPDLFAHMGPTLRRLIPGRHEPSALRGRARALVTVWVLVVIPLLFSLMLGAVVLLPRLAASAWDTGRLIVDDLPHQSPVGIGASLVRLLALLLPLVGSALIAQKLLRTAVLKAHAWSDGHGFRRLVVLACATAGAAAAAWAWFPAGQYQPVAAAEGGTLVGFTHVLASPTTAARPPAAQRAQPAAPKLAPGRYLAIAMIPRDGATNAHPALYVIPGHDGDPPVAIAVGDGGGTTSDTEPSSVVNANAFQFKLPSAPGPGDSQALAVNHTDGSVVYDIAYSLVTVKGGAPVTNTNSAFAFANCHACATVAVSFQVVLVIGQSNRIAPINAAGALNEECPACVTAALAYQIVVTLKSQPSDELMQKLQASLQKLNAISTLGSLQEINAQVAAVQKEIDDELQQSGLVDKPKPPPPPATTTAPTTTAPPATTTTTNGATTTTPSTTTAPTTTAPPPATTTAPAATTTDQSTTTTAPTETTPTTTTTG